MRRHPQWLTCCSRACSQKSTVSCTKESGWFLVLKALILKGTPERIEHCWQRTRQKALMDASNVAYQSSTGLVAMLLHPPRSTDPARAASSSRGPARSPAAPASSWLLSKTTGILSLSVSPESCRLKLAIKEYCLLDQDLAASAPALCLRLLRSASLQLAVSACTVSFSECRCSVIADS